MEADPYRLPKSGKMTSPTSLGGAERASNAARSSVPTGYQLKYVPDEQCQAGENFLLTKLAPSVAQ